MYSDDEDQADWVCMASCYEITEDFASCPSPMVNSDPDSSVKTLLGSAKFRAFFDGFGFTPAARLEMTKAIINIVEVHHEACMSAKRSVPRTIREDSNAITFTEADMRIPFPHNKPLYVIVCVNGVERRRAFLDGGASINLMS